MNYPIGVQTFEKIRNEGRVYVDKTAFVYDLASSGTYYFLSRPRRFGKSLLLSTLKSYFEGRKDLFKGLAIERMEQTWSSYPVIHIDLSGGEYINVEGLEGQLAYLLSQYEHKFGVDNPPITAAQRFDMIIRRAYESTGRPVVVLVDEYDKPLLETIGDERLQQSYRKILKPFYGVLKSCDAYIRFAMLTGVTKYGHLSVFSDLNNLRDISLLPRYAAICGITQGEITDALMAGVNEMAQVLGLSLVDTIERLRSRYDGYRFSRSDVKVFNPYSLFNALADGTMSDYWFQTGTSSYLVYLIRDGKLCLSALDRLEVSANLLSSVDTEYISPVPVLYQSGYLTIVGYDPESELYTLDYPNMEVRRGFMNYLLPIYANQTPEKTGMEIEQMARDLRRGDPQAFCRRLSCLYSSIPYSANKQYEFYYQDILYVALVLLGYRVQVESHIATGRADVVIQTDDYVYIIEFKVDRSAQEAIDQIETKGYASPYLCSDKNIFKIGLNFNTHLRTFDPPIIQ